MDTLQQDGTTHTPGQPPSATSVCIHLAGLRAYGAYSTVVKRIPDSFPSHEAKLLKQWHSQWLNESHQSPLRGQRRVNCKAAHQLPDYPHQKSFW